MDEKSRGQGVVSTVESSSISDQDGRITIRAGQSSNLSDQEDKFTRRAGQSSIICDHEDKFTARTGQSSTISDQEAKITITASQSCENRGDENGNGDRDEKFVSNEGDSSNGVGGKDDKYSCVIDVKSGNGSLGGGEGENQRVCRICHLNKWEIGKEFADLIELGCGCKGELGFAHSHCAEAWFRLRGNRSCEICSKTATNITGVADFGFMEEWNERRVILTGPFASERRRGCLNGQPLCNFLMACLVIAFVLPWFFRVNLF